MALALADAGATCVGTSGMMDGQVGAVRAALDCAGRADVASLPTPPKYASAFYGPFREAVESRWRATGAPTSRTRRNGREALREVALDVAEGADMVMVKPALAYLDVGARRRGRGDSPVAAYQVSGEYAMVEAAAARGWIDRERTVLETLTSIKRAGAFDRAHLLGGRGRRLAARMNAVGDAGGGGPAGGGALAHTGSNRPSGGASSTSRACCSTSWVASWARRARCPLPEYEISRSSRSRPGGGCGCPEIADRG